MTVDLDDRYAVTITYGRGPKGHLAVGEIFERKTGKKTGIDVRGEGRTIGSAGNRAIADARRKVPIW